MLGQLLPVAGLSFLIGGFLPTRIETAQRHLDLERVVQLDFASQLGGIVLMVGLAWWTGSIWALVVGGVFATAVKLAAGARCCPATATAFAGSRRRGTSWSTSASGSSSARSAAFWSRRGTGSILGRDLSLDVLGIYNLGYFLASFPLLLAGAVTGRVLIPLYRDCPPAASAANFQKLQLMRMGLTGGVVTLLLVWRSSASRWSSCSTIRGFTPPARSWCCSPAPRSRRRS